MSVTTTTTLAKGAADYAAAMDLELIGRAELAALMKVSGRHLARLAAAKRLPEPLRLGRNVLRWRLRDIQQWLAAGCPAATANNTSDEA